MKPAALAETMVLQVILSVCLSAVNGIAAVKTHNMSVEFRQSF